MPVDMATASLETAVEDDTGTDGLVAKNIVAKPGKIPLGPEDFEEWRFDFENFMAVVKAEFMDEMRLAITEEADANGSINDSTNPQLRKRSVLLYAVFELVVTGQGENKFARFKSRTKRI